jgi:nicotinamide mononucleotide transporter
MESPATPPVLAYEPTPPLVPARQIGTPVLLALVLATSAVALFMQQTGRAGWIEALAFVSGAICVWLTVRENVWNFPIGLVCSATFCVVFFQARLFADAGLQVVYIGLGLVGWYLWLFGGAQRTELRVGRASPLELGLCLAFVAITTVGLWKLLAHVGGSASFFDALTTSISLAAQWLLNRKRLENWVFWIVVDVIYIPLYLYKDLYLTAVLYGVFLCMATIGLIQWRLTWHRQSHAGSCGAGSDAAGVGVSAHEASVGDAR